MNLRGAARRHGPPYDRLKIWEKGSQITLFCRVNSFFLPQRTPIFSFLIGVLITLRLQRELHYVTCGLASQQPSRHYFFGVVASSMTTFVVAPEKPLGLHTHTQISVPRAAPASPFSKTKSSISRR